MKEKIKQYSPPLLALVFLILFGWALSMYIQPMEDVSIDLSLILQEDRLLADPEDFDNKGWTVYTAEGENRTELTPDGFGGYTGLELGQTFYFSRVMEEEELDSPTLQLGTAEQTFSVWLDDVLIYTDQPELDNRIGYLTLPMNEWLRDDPIIITLPGDYQGKTLTIAQSTPEWAETSRVMAYPASVRLYCGYAYESGLISETYATALQCAGALVIGLVLLFAFVRSRDWGFLCLSFVALCWTLQTLVGTSFHYKFYSPINDSMGTLIPYLANLALLVFLVLQGKSQRKGLWPMVAAYAVSTALFAAWLSLGSDFGMAHHNAGRFIYCLPNWICFLALMAVMVLSWGKWRKQSFFYRFFTPAATAFIALRWLEAIFISEKGVVTEQIAISLSSLQVDYIFQKMSPGIMLAAVLTAAVEAIKLELERRTDRHLIALKSDLALSSYENLTRQHEEVMMIRHDMLQHFHTLREMSDSQQVRDYLTELIGQNETIRPVVRCENKMLDILLNGKLSLAVDAGVHVQIEQVSVPEHLPLSDTDLCSLVTNIIDNAADAALQSHLPSPFIRLNIHTKDGYLALVCENSYDPTAVKQTKKETVPKHGLGLKIIRGITQRYDGVLIIEEGECFRVKIVIPLN